MSKLELLRNNMQKFCNTFETQADKTRAAELFANIYGYYKNAPGSPNGVVWVDPRQLELFELTDPKANNG